MCTTVSSSTSTSVFHLISPEEAVLYRRNWAVFPQCSFSCCRHNQEAERQILHLGCQLVPPAAAHNVKIITEDFESFNEHDLQASLCH